MKLQKDTKRINHQVRLSQDLNDFVLKISEELDCSKSEAIRSMIRACRAGFKKEASQ